MAAEQRKLLEQLMGEQLMSGPGPRAPQVPITDPKVCRSFLVGNCPHDLFTNTKQDFGPCPKIHNEALKTEYENADADQKRRWGFEYDYLRDMKKYVDECDRRIDNAERRLEKTPEEIRQTQSLLRQIQDCVENMELLLQEIPCAAMQHKMVALAVQLAHDWEVEKWKKGELERQLKALSDTGGPSGHQKLQVCDVCGAYLSRLDNDRRLADHFYGKMHLGYSQMRKTYETLSKELKNKPPPPRRDSEDSPRGPRGDIDPSFERGYGGRGGYRGGGGYGRGGGYRGRGGYTGRW